MWCTPSLHPTNPPKTTLCTLRWCGSGRGACFFEGSQHQAGKRQQLGLGHDPQNHGKKKKNHTFEPQVPLPALGLKGLALDRASPCPDVARSCAFMSYSRLLLWRFGCQVWVGCWIGRVVRRTYPVHGKVCRGSCLRHMSCYRKASSKRVYSHEILRPFQGGARLLVRLQDPLKWTTTPFSVPNCKLVWPTRNQ